MSAPKDAPPAEPRDPDDLALIRSMAAAWRARARAEAAETAEMEDPGPLTEEDIEAMRGDWINDGRGFGATP